MCEFIPNRIHQATYRHSGLVMWLRLNVTDVLSVLYNRFMHISEMAMKVRQPSSSSGALQCAVLTLQNCGLGPYEY